MTAMRLAAFAVLVLLLAGSAAVAYGAYRWRTRTDALRSRLGAASSDRSSAAFDPGALSGLPEPVGRYLARVVPEGTRPLIRAVVEHEGTFRMGDDEDDWRPFTSTELFVPGAPGFVWDATIRAAPGLPVRVRDAFVAGRGVMHAEVLGLVPVVDQAGSPELARGALLRYLAEAVWLPTALLPGQGVRWEPVDDSTARAVLDADGVSVELEFRFGPEGMVREVYAEDRPRDVDGRPVPTPWSGTFDEYREVEGLWIPVRGEVGWRVEGVWRPYWRGRITGVDYGGDG